MFCYNFFDKSLTILHFRSGQYSESEAEDDPASNVTLPQNLAGRGSKAGAKSAVRMIELGYILVYYIWNSLVKENAVLINLP